MNESSIQFLHCMKKGGYLQQALTQGLMFTDHRIDSSLFPREHAHKVLTELLLPALKRQLCLLRKPWETLSEQQQKMLFIGLGDVGTSCPMICFTEVLHGRRIATHSKGFGSYGLVVREDWIRKHYGDRVIYVDGLSPTSVHLYTLLTSRRILSIHLNKGEPTFSNDVFTSNLLFFSYLQNRKDIEQAEWRIPGSTGITGGVRATGNRIALPLAMIEYVFVPSEPEVGYFEALVRDIATKEACTSPPPVMVFPETIPSRPVAT